MIYKSVYETKAYEYATKIVNGDIISSKDVYNCCKRFINDIEKAKNDDYPYYFDLEQATKIEVLARNLKFPTGLLAGQSIDLHISQSFTLSNIYCWRFKDNPKKKRYRMAIILKARKNSKSQDMAFFSILSMMEIYNGANFSVAGKRDQASISFKDAKMLIQSNPTFADNFKLQRSQIIFKGNNSTFTPLSSDSRTLDGILPEMLLIDEAMIVPQEVKDSVTSGFGGSASPICICISTAYAVDFSNNWCYDEMEYGKAVNRGEVENERFFSICYQLDDKEEVHDEKMWIKANPLWDVSETLRETLREDYKKAKVNPAMMRNFLTKNMNVFLDAKTIDTYINQSAWKQLEQSFIDFSGKPVFVGCDLSITTDLTSVTFATYNEDLDTFDFKNHSFLPSSKVFELESNDQLPYRQYEEEGYCTFIKGDVVQQEIVFQHIKEFIELSNAELVVLAYDPYNSDYLIKRCNEEGIRVLEVRQGYRMLSGHTKRLRELIFTRNVRFEENPILDRAVFNAVTEKDRFGNEIISKLKSSEKIDPLASLIFSFLACDINKENYFSQSYDDYIL